VAVPAPVAEGATSSAPSPVHADAAADADTAAGGGNGDRTRGGGGVGTGTGVGTPPVPLDDGAMRRLPYTRAAVDLNVSGDVVMDILIDESGRVSSVHPRNRLGYGLDEIAVREVKKIPFRPARDAAGRPIAFWFRWNVHFYPPVR
jgi:TonB family protein